MATYAIGDVQGCLDQLLALLKRIAFDASVDQLWFCGDLVNRGPKSVQVLRLVRDLGARAVCVLGNHDLHLLAAHYGYREPGRKDTFSDVLQAPDRDELIDWLRHRPLLHIDAKHKTAMVHAGIPPQWSIDDARRHAQELEKLLADDKGIKRFLAKMYGDTPRHWDDGLRGAERWRYITNALTRMRYIDAQGRLELEENRAPGRQRNGLTPWFAVDKRRNRGHRIVFGHWATLQIERPLDPRFDVVHLDTGCVWGATLSAVRLDDGKRLEVPGWKP